MATEGAAEPGSHDFALRASWLRADSPHPTWCSSNPSTPTILDRRLHQPSCCSDLVLPTKGVPEKGVHERGTGFWKCHVIQAFDKTAMFDLKDTSLV